MAALPPPAAAAGLQLLVDDPKLRLRKVGSELKMALPLRLRLPPLFDPKLRLLKKEGSAGLCSALCMYSDGRLSTLPPMEEPAWTKSSGTLPLEGKANEMPRPTSSGAQSAELLLQLGAAVVRGDDSAVPQSEPTSTTFSRGSGEVIDGRMTELRLA